MSGEEPRYAIDPTRVVVRDDDGETEYVGLSLEIGEGGIVLELRSGALNREEIGLDYADLEGVGAAKDLSYRLELETPDTSYAVLNVTASEREATAMVDYVQERIDRAATASVSTNGGASRPATDGHDGGQPAAGGQATGGGQAAGSGQAAGGSQAVGASGAAGGTSADGSAAEELKRWVELNEEGIISDEELEEKKRQLL